MQEKKGKSGSRFCVSFLALFAVVNACMKGGRLGSRKCNEAEEGRGLGLGSGSPYVSFSFCGCCCYCCRRRCCCCCCCACVRVCVGVCVGYVLEPKGENEGNFQCLD